MDLLHGPVSILTAALQYLSSLLSGEPKRLILLWRQSAPSFTEWFQRTWEFRLLRRMVLLVSAQLHRRFVMVVNDFPWVLVKLADARVPDPEKQRIAT
eukprot:2075034-Pyramimonas_sp.AAC.1